MHNEQDDEALRFLANRILTLRKEEDYYQAQVETAKGVQDVAPPQLVGNLGGIRFYSDGVAYGDALIAASASIKHELEDYLQDEGIPLVVVKATEDGDIFAVNNGQLSGPHRPRFQVTKGRRHDSEYILLHMLDAFLQGSGRRTGKVYLLTERIPCAACTRIISWFAQQYPQIQIAVYYLTNTSRKETVDGERTTIVRDVDDFHAACSSPQVEIGWLTLDGDTVNTGVHPRGRPVGSTEWVRAEPYPAG